jgi:hypothetical protein
MHPDAVKEREAEIELLKRVGQCDQQSFGELCDRFAVLFSTAGPTVPARAVGKFTVISQLPDGNGPLVGRRERRRPALSAERSLFSNRFQV